MHMSRAKIGLLLAAMFFGAPISALAQGLATANNERTYGTAAEVSHTLQAFAFTGRASADSAVFDAKVTTGSRFCSGVASCIFAAAVLLPEGSLVTRVEVDGCVLNATGSVVARFFRTGAQDTANELVAVSNDLGCGPRGVTTMHTIDNATGSYRVQVHLTSTQGLLNDNIRFQAVRIFYRLQVSPAPAVATFDDVPTDHPFFPFVEALVVAGITTGCNASPLMYCPDQAVTRGQMAKFLSTALGLHFAP